MKIRQLRVGDVIDLETFPVGYPFDESTLVAIEYELAEVIGERDDGTEDGSPFTVESPDCWVLHTTEGSFGVSPDWEVTASHP